MTDRATKIWDFIKLHTDAGRTVYIKTATRITIIKAKHVAAGLIRVRNGHVEVVRGKHWDSVNFCSFEAR